MKKNIETADFDATGYSYTLSLISGKYKPVILYCLMEYDPARFNQMQGAGKGRPDPAESLSADPAESGVLLK